MAENNSADKSTNKVRYCRLCGNLIDAETKKCTNCGKQRFPVKEFCISFVMLIFSVAVVGGIYHFASPKVKDKELLSDSTKNNSHKPVESTTSSEKSIDYRDLAKKRNRDPITSVGEYISNPLGGTGAGVAARSASDSYHKEYPEREERTNKLIKITVPEYYKDKPNTRWSAHVEDTYNDFINSFNAYASNYKTDYDNDEDIKVASVGSAFMAGKLRDKGQKLMDYAKKYPDLFTAPDGYNKTGGDYIQSLVENALDTVDRMDKSYDKMLKYVRNKSGD